MADLDLIARVQRMLDMTRETRNDTLAGLRQKLGDAQYQKLLNAVPPEERAALQR